MRWIEGDGIPVEVEESARDKMASEAVAAALSDESGIGVIMFERVEDGDSRLDFQHEGGACLLSASLHDAKALARAILADELATLHAALSKAKAEARRGRAFARADRERRRKNQERAQRGAARRRPR